MRKDMEAVEPVIKFLCSLLVFFTGVLIGCEVFFPKDGQVFQVFSSAFAGILGALLMRIKMAHGDTGNNTTTVIGDDAQVTPSTPPTA